jgi:hypothetical protein
MTKQTYSIGILSLTALILLLANLMSPPRVDASQGVVNPGRDYQVVSSPEQSGGDALYVLNNRTGMLAVFTYDPQSRRMVARVVSPITAAFPATGATGTTTGNQAPRPR